LLLVCEPFKAYEMRTLG